MKLDWIMKLLLLILTALLAVLVFRPLVQPTPVRAQGLDTYPFYVEPGYTMLRKPDGTAQIYGKMIIDMRTGSIWGFPTGTQMPYPVDPAKTTPPKSHPMYLGQLDFSEVKP